ncbi:hypothetical protein [Actinopolymorpha pittospori]|uniref:Uncharacterized protein n=1 Tax=Actinopolymorpha pittospori TaxID=648752 RepID=A0A927MUL1_9ACTN|nr:hypothetical protein [Actinopolymorpha pittospori]MBE1606494.1 hypothetical protein [Actinopolymorpha pittospori]
MRVALSTYGSHGDLEPVAAVACTIHTNGATVAAKLLLDRS